MKTIFTLAFVLIAAISSLAVPEDGLVLYLPFSGDATDHSGLGNHGTVNAPVPTTDRFGLMNEAYEYDGTDDTITCGQPPSLDFTGPFTITAWINPYETGGYGSKYRMIAGKWFDWNPGDVDQRQYTFGYCLDGLVHFAIGAGRANSAVFSQSALQVGVWTHVAGVYDGATLKIYVNGILDGTATTSLAMVSQPVSVMVGGIGSGGWGQEYFRGKLDEVRMYNRGLTEEEISQVVEFAGQPYPQISVLGFSNNPEGDQDVTEFYDDETLYISLWDADLVNDDPLTRVTAHLVQRGPTAGSRKTEQRIRLEKDESGVYRGSIPLSSSSSVDALVMIQASTPQQLIFARHSTIRVMPAASR